MWHDRIILHTNCLPEVSSLSIKTSCFYCGRFHCFVFFFSISCPHLMTLFRLVINMIGLFLYKQFTESTHCEKFYFIIFLASLCFFSKEELVKYQSNAVLLKRQLSIFQFNIFFMKVVTTILRTKIKWHVIWFS